MPADSSARRAAFERQVGGKLAFGGDVALLDAGARGDPFVGGVDALGELAVRDHPRRQIGAAADHLGTQERGTVQHGQTAAAWAAGAAGAAGDRRASSIADRLVESVGDHVDGDADRVGEADRVGAAMALHDDAVEPEQDGAVVAARIGPAADLLQRVARHEVAEPGDPRGPERAAQEFGDRASPCPSAVLSATLPVKPSVTTTSTVPAGMSSPSTKPWNWIGSALVRRIAAAARTSSWPFMSSEPTLRRPTSAACSRARCARTRRPCTANWTRLSAIAFDIGAEVEHHALAAHRREERRRSPAGRCRRACAAKSSPSPSTRRCCPPRRRRRPGRRAPRRSQGACSTAGPDAAPRSASSSFGTVSSVCRMVQRLASLGDFFSSGASRASSPNSRYWTSGKRLQAMLAPSTTMCGASSPPMASRAIVRRAFTMAAPALGSAGIR